MLNPIGKFMSHAKWSAALEAVLTYAAMHGLVQLGPSFMFNLFKLWVRFGRRPVNIRVSEVGITISYNVHNVYHFAYQFDIKGVYPMFPGLKYKSWNDEHGNTIIPQGI